MCRHTKAEQCVISPGGAPLHAILTVTLVEGHLKLKVHGLKNSIYQDRP
jgi:hypothetical protein